KALVCVIVSSRSARTLPIFRPSRRPHKMQFEKLGRPWQQRSSHAQERWTLCPDSGCSSCVLLQGNPRQDAREASAGMPTFATLHTGVESPFAWLRLIAAVALGTIGSVGMWSVPVVLPAVQGGVGAARPDASLPFSLAIIGFACGGVLMGRLTDRFGIAAPVICGALALSIGYVAAGFAPNLMLFALVHVLIGLGSSATFGPLIADTSQWFTRRRGIAV